jgi:hypothetical protein
MFLSFYIKATAWIKILSLLFFSLFFLNCAGTLEQDLKELDKIYGYCDNPQRNLRGNKYDTCKAKERAAGPDGKVDEKSALTFDEIVEKIRGGPRETIINSTANPFLWRASLKTMSPYDLKIADNQGGFIQTEWIYKDDKPNNRCLIKIQITSIELISTGVETNIKCEDKIENSWRDDNYKYLDEEKQLILKILELANNYSYENSN